MTDETSSSWEDLGTDTVRLFRNQGLMSDELAARWMEYLEEGLQPEVPRSLIDDTKAELGGNRQADSSDSS